MSAQCPVCLKAVGQIHQYTRCKAEQARIKAPLECGKNKKVSPMSLFAVEPTGGKLTGGKITASLIVRAMELAVNALQNEVSHLQI
jgi:hypothetical protein